MDIKLNSLVNGAEYTVTTDDHTNLIRSITSKNGEILAVPDSMSPFGAVFGVPFSISTATVTHVARSETGAIAVLFKDGTLAAHENLGDDFVFGRVQEGWAVVLDGKNLVPDNRVGGIEPDPVEGIAYLPLHNNLLVVTFESGACATWNEEAGWHAINHPAQPDTRTPGTKTPGRRPGWRGYPLTH